MIQGNAKAKYDSKKLRFKKQRNTQDWNDDVRGVYVRHLVKHYGGKTIPYNFTLEDNKICNQLFDKTNTWNFIYYSLFMALDRGLFIETDAGLEYKGWY